MRRREMAIRTGLILYVLGLGALLLRSEDVPGRPLSGSELARIHGLNPMHRSNTTYPVGCEAYTGQMTPQQCRAQIGLPGAALGDCTVCSDKIATYTATMQGPSGTNQFLDGQYQCNGQMSSAPCIGNANFQGQCGTYAPVQGVFCTALVPDWGPQ